MRRSRRFMRADRQADDHGLRSSLLLSIWRLEDANFSITSDATHMHPCKKPGPRLLCVRLDVTGRGRGRAACACGRLVLRRPARARAGVAFCRQHGTASPAHIAPSHLTNYISLCCGAVGFNLPARALVRSTVDQLECCCSLDDADDARARAARLQNRKKPQSPPQNSRTRRPSKRIRL